jgi:hypothetical protein
MFAMSSGIGIGAGDSGDLARASGITGELRPVGKPSPTPFDMIFGIDGIV